MADKKETKLGGKVVFVPYPPLEKIDGKPIFSADIVNMPFCEYYDKYIKR